MASVSLTATGIDFSDYQTPLAGMGEEILDRYEQGTWAPITNGSSGSRAGTWSHPGSGAYEVAGRMAHIHWGIAGTSMYFTSSSGYQTVTGIPMAASHVAAYPYAGEWTSNGVTQSIAGSLYLNDVTSYLHSANPDWSTGGSSHLGCNMVYMIA